MPHPPGDGDATERLILTTRAVRLRDGEAVSFAPEALDSVAEHIGETYVPLVIEHLHYLPPMGRMVGARVEVTEDGERNLYAREELLPQLLLRERESAIRQTIPSAEATGEPAVGSGSPVRLLIAPRNFDPEMLKELTLSAPVPIEHEDRWADLPPLDWVIVIGGPLSWMLAKFAGSFLDVLGKESATDLVEWIRAKARRAKRPQRANLVTLRMELPNDKYVLGVVPFHSSDADSAVVLLDALERLRTVALLATAHVEKGYMPDLERACFIFHEGEWRFAWVATREATYRTSWFDENYPRPALFLATGAPGDT